MIQSPASALNVDDLFAESPDETPVVVPRPRNPLLQGRRPATAPLPRAHWPKASTTPADAPDPACVVKVVRRPVQTVPRPIAAPVPANVGAKPLSYERFSAPMETVDETPGPEAEAPSTGRRWFFVGGLAAGVVAGSLIWHFVW